MEIERQRVSVSTSVLAFNYKRKKINILDTQGTRILQKIPLEL
jgi:peptide chain release factor 3